MIRKSPKNALKAILGGVLFASFILISCNNEKKEAPATTTVDTAATRPIVDPPKGDNMIDTAATRPIVDPPK
jgi:hypothetical protein